MEEWREEREEEEEEEEGSYDKTKRKNEKDSYIDLGLLAFQWQS